MKRYLPLVFIVAASAVAIAIVQHNHINTEASPQALLTAVADAQHELTRVPAQLDHMSDAEEIAVGHELAKHAAPSTGVMGDDPSHDAAVEAYLQMVGSRVAAHARRKLPWTFHYIPSPEFLNAFAIPGGQVFVGQGMLNLMQSEDALAAVLGHEIEHIDLRHCAERAQTQAELHQLGPLGDFAGIPVHDFLAGYNKEEELEADRDGTIRAVQSGYSYTGILQLFNEFKALEGSKTLPVGRPHGPLEEAAQLSLSTLSGYFASHPPSNQRTEQVRTLANERGWSAQPLQCLGRAQPRGSSRKLPFACY
jgi:predicted Zn-dependent protease